MLQFAIAASRGIYLHIGYRVRKCETADRIR